MKDFYRLMARPVVVISTISPRGFPNAAPFSFSSPMASRPTPLFGFCCEVEHDTWRNVQQNGEFVVNLVGAEFGQLIEKLETHYPYEVSEIEKSGLTAMKAIKVKPPRIAEAYGWIECKMRESLALSERSVWIIGEVQYSDAKDEYYNAREDVIDVGKAKTLNHIWGDVFTITMTETHFKRASR